MAVFKKPDVPISMLVLVAIFGMATFLHADGLASEVPVLVQRLPEYWQLGAYFIFTVCVLCNVPPLIYFIVHTIRPETGGGGKNGVFMICALLVTGIVASLLMILFWDATTEIGGEEHSTAFILLTFVSGTINFTSLMVFMSYMVRLPSSCIPAFHVGEGLPALTSSLVGLIQGAGKYECVMTNRTDNSTFDKNITYAVFDESLKSNNSYVVIDSNYSTITNQIEAVYIDPVFSVEVFFSHVLAFGVICFISFLLIQFLPYYRKYHVNNKKKQCSEETISLNEKKDGEANLPEKNAESVRETPEVLSPLVYGNKLQDEEHKTPELHKEKYEGTEEIVPVGTRAYIWLLFVAGWTCGIRFGMLEAVQSYSALPYGPLMFSLTNRLALSALPVGSITSYFFPTRSLTIINIHVAVNFLTVVFLMVLAVHSPHPPFWDTMPLLGGSLAIVAWIISTFTVGYTRAVISILMRERGERALLWFSIISLTGSLVTGIPVFVCVVVLRLFHDAPLCNSLHVTSP